ncbi:MAG: hypothetical protein ACRDPR_09885, partial [Nocardioidaceae bacterium]
GTESAAGETVPAQQWIGSLCTGISEWQAELGEVPDSSSNPDLVKLKAAMVSFLDALVRNTDKLIGRVRNAGVPDIDQGEQAATAFKAAFEGMGTSFRNAKSAIDGTPTNDQAAFAAGLQQVGVVLRGSIDSAQKAFGDISARYPEIAEAAKNVPSCTKSG